MKQGRWGGGWGTNSAFCLRQSGGDGLTIVACFFFFFVFEHACLPFGIGDFLCEGNAQAVAVVLGMSFFGRPHG